MMGLPTPSKITIRNRNVVKNSQGIPVVMSRNCEVIITDSAKRERARFRVPYGARLLVDDGAEVTRTQKLAEWLRGHAAFDDVYLSDSVEIPDNPPVPVAISYKRVWRFATPQALGDFAALVKAAALHRERHAGLLKGFGVAFRLARRRAQQDRHVAPFDGAKTILRAVPHGMVRRLEFPQQANADGMGRG